MSLPMYSDSAPHGYCYNNKDAGDVAPPPYCAKVDDDINVEKGLKSEAKAVGCYDAGNSRAGKERATSASGTEGASGEEGALAKGEASWCQRKWFSNDKWQSKNAQIRALTAQVNDLPNQLAQQKQQQLEEHQRELKKKDEQQQKQQQEHEEVLLLLVLQHQREQQQKDQQHHQQQQQLYERILKYAEAGGRERQRLEVADLKLTPRLWLIKPAGEGRRTVSDPLTRHD